jgi:hypothetical protein
MQPVILIPLRMFKVPTRDVRGSHKEHSWFPPRTIVDVLYCISEGTSHALNLCVRPTMNNRNRMPNDHLTLDIA